MTASLAPLTGAAAGGADSASNAGLDNNLNVSSFESTTHFEERTSRYWLIIIVT